MWGRGKWCGGAGGNANSIIFIIYYSKNNDFVVKRENKNDDFCIFFYYQRADDSILSLIAELKDSKTVLAAYHTNDPNAGMANSRNLSKFKLFLADTGLFTTLAFKDKDFTENVIYEKLLNDKLSSNLGYTKDLRKDGDIVCMPVYMAMFL